MNKETKKKELRNYSIDLGFVYFAVIVLNIAQLIVYQ